MTYRGIEYDRQKEIKFLTFFIRTDKLFYPPCACTASSSRNRLRTRIKSGRLEFFSEDLRKCDQSNVVLMEGGEGRTSEPFQSAPVSAMVWAILQDVQLRPGLAVQRSSTKHRNILKTWRVTDLRIYLLAYIAVRNLKSREDHDRLVDCWNKFFWKWL